MADMTTTSLIEEDEETMATEPIYLSNDVSKYSTPNITLDHQLECIYPDSINQLIASQLEQWSNTGTETVSYPPNPNMSMMSDDEDQMNPTPIIGNPEQYTPQIPQRRNHPIQLRQHVQPIPDTPESPPPEDQGQDDIPNQPSSIPLNSPPPNITKVADGLRNLTLHPHPKCNETVTGCLVCGKSYDQVIEETVADYINQTTQSRQYANAKSKEMLLSTVLRAECSLFSPRDCRRLPPVAAYSTPLTTMDKTRARRDMLCPYLKNKLTKLSSNKFLDKSLPPFLRYIIIY